MHGLGCSPSHGKTGGVRLRALLPELLGSQWCGPAAAVHMADIAAAFTAPSAHWCSWWPQHWQFWLVPESLSAHRALVAQTAKNLPAMHEIWVRSLGPIPGSGRYPWRREWKPTPVFLPGESHGQRSLMDCNPWARKESDTTEWLTWPQRRSWCPVPSPSQSHRSLSQGQNLNHILNPSH